jgi:hypothetical protein
MWFFPTTIILSKKSNRTKGQMEESSGTMEKSS